MNANGHESGFHRNGRKGKLANVCLRLAEVGEQHERDGGSSGEGDEQQEGDADGGIRFAIDVFAHDVAVGSYPEDGVVGERHDDHPEDDGDVYKLERTQTGETDEKSQAEHAEPGGGVDRHFTHAAALAPFKIEKL